MTKIIAPPIAALLEKLRKLPDRTETDTENYLVKVSLPDMHDIHIDVAGIYEWWYNQLIETNRLVIKNPIHFGDVIDMAKANGSYAQLLQKLIYLGEYSDQDTFCEIFSGWGAPKASSLEFQLYRIRPEGNRPWMNGGLVYHDDSKQWSVNA